MHSTLTTLLNQLDSPIVSETNVIPWGCPVPSFGDLSRSRVATLGINPSNREFVDQSGKELDGPSRRFPTLQSFGLTSWSDVDARHVRVIVESCYSYFEGNPYDAWFKKLNHIVSGANASYSGVPYHACHLDLIPFATESKWTDISIKDQSSLLGMTGDTLAQLLGNSPVQTLILNGASVVAQFKKISGVCLKSQIMPAWSLQRTTRRNVLGIAYRGMVDSLSGISLGRQVLVLGFNHNIQSSFGVTAKIVNSIRRWVCEETEAPGK